MRMMCGIVALATAMLALATAARADEASDYMAAAGDETVAFSKCAADYAIPRAKSSERADDLAVILAARDIREMRHVTAIAQVGRVGRSGLFLFQDFDLRETVAGAAGFRK